MPLVTSLQGNNSKLQQCLQRLSHGTGMIDKSVHAWVSISRDGEGQAELCVTRPFIWWDMVTQGYAVVG